ncbi:DUF5302 domain-containing protein [Cellulomonas marina]|uniref:DUF5302 domain-containing protein n=1 Tax=Cellulomonas marina TaxID=988821 RepID=A0A1I0VJ55_9CELL|nr:DUF5302 domain-containing protein [Cellulomonas marina]GIG27925.1 hypothetical protein Cma02nite_05250 [Cellulomonas marina]SFA76539.1 hypothetical protein SAMN05421867_101437 [Cellulomonas marina]
MADAPDAPAAGGTTTGPAGAPADAPTDAKARFREALERKKAQQHRTAAGPGGGSAVHGSETAGPTQRRFRRKSG